MSNNPHHQALKSQLELELNGQNRMEISPRFLNIVWGKDSRYWNVPDKDGEAGAAELFQVSWLEVTGCVSKTDPTEEYEVGFKISLTPDAFGWSGSPVYILVKRGKGSKFKGQRFTSETFKEEATEIKTKVGKLENGADDDDSNKIYFGLYEVWSGKWKGGLKIHHAFIQKVPKP